MSSGRISALGAIHLYTVELPGTFDLFMKLSLLTYVSGSLNIPTFVYRPGVWVLPETWYLFRNPCCLHINQNHGTDGQTHADPDN